MHPTTQLAYARQRRAAFERHAAAARTRHQLLAARHVRRAAVLSATVRAAARAGATRIERQASAAPATSACCPA